MGALRNFLAGWPSRIGVLAAQVWFLFEILGVIAGFIADIPGTWQEYIKPGLDAVPWHTAWEHKSLLAAVIITALSTTKWWRLKLSESIPGNVLGFVAPSQGHAKSSGTNVLEDDVIDGPAINPEISILEQSVADLNASIIEIEKKVNAIDAKLSDQSSKAKTAQIENSIEELRADVSTIRSAAVRGGAMADREGLNAKLWRWENFLRIVSAVPPPPNLIVPAQTEDDRSMNLELTERYVESRFQYHEGIGKHMDRRMEEAFGIFDSESYREKSLANRQKIIPEPTNRNIMAGDEKHWIDGEKKLAHILMSEECGLQQSFVQSKIDKIKKDIGRASALINTVEQSHEDNA